MRSLGTIRARVERLAAVGLPAPETMFISWQFRYQQLPGLRRRSGGPRAGDGAGRGRRRPAPGRGSRQGSFYSTDDLTTCPRCHAALP